MVFGVLAVCAIVAVMYVRMTNPNSSPSPPCSSAAAQLHPKHNPISRLTAPHHNP
jgi:hypothetical protein